MIEKTEMARGVSGSDQGQAASSATSTAVLRAAAPDAGIAAAGSDERGVESVGSSTPDASLSPQVTAVGSAALVKLAVSLPPAPAVQGTADNDADGRSKRIEAAGSKLEDAYEKNEQDQLLHAADETLARLYDTHDTWFGSDKQVNPPLSNQHQRSVSSSSAAKDLLVSEDALT